MWQSCVGQRFGLFRLSGGSSDMRIATEMKNAITTKHKLDFYIGEWKPKKSWISWLLDRLENKDEYPFISWHLYRVGTVSGQWRETPEAFEILSFLNDTPGNGHLEDVFEWFEFACKLAKKPLRIREFTNKKFKQHCIEKRGFKELNKNDLIKVVL